ncbi:MAG: translation elongation factor Ts [Coriobacteriia bacterium]|nr:translation elongation factor Ts [Coriobacteriia bacterium]
MAITASQVKELREITGAGMMECKKALTESNGDMDGAIDILRTKGLAAVAKKAGRATNEGTVVAAVSDDGKIGALLELNCETDFVAINDKFQAYANRIVKVVLDQQPADVDALKTCKDGDETVEDIITDAIHVLGENIQIARIDTLSADAISSYIHAGGKIGVLVAFETGISAKDFEQCGKDVAMQVAAINPISATRDDVPKDVVAHELEIYKAQAADSGKPEEIQEKIAMGRMNKFYKEQCLTEQVFVKDPDLSVQKYVDGVASDLGGSIKILSFKRFQLGE